MITTSKPWNVFEAILKYGHDEDFIPLADASFRPTDAPAGSQEKIEVLCRRIELGQPLWHNNDRVDFGGLTGVVRPRYNSESQAEEATRPGNSVSERSTASGASLLRRARNSPIPVKAGSVKTNAKSPAIGGDTTDQSPSTVEKSSGNQPTGRVPTELKQRLISKPRCDSELQEEEATRPGNNVNERSTASGASPLNRAQNSAMTGAAGSVKIGAESPSLGKDTTGQSLSKVEKTSGKQPTGRVATELEQRLISSMNMALQAGTISRQSYISEMSILMRRGVNVGDLSS